MPRLRQPNIATLCPIRWQPISKGTPGRKKEPRPRLPVSAGPGRFLAPFSANELEKGIKGIKDGKAYGMDEVGGEMTKHFSLAARDWLLRLYNTCISSYSIPKIWQRAKIIVLPIRGKDHSDPKTPDRYRCCAIRTNYWIAWCCTELSAM